MATNLSNAIAVIENDVTKYDLNISAAPSSLGIQLSSMLWENVGLPSIREKAVQNNKFDAKKFIENTLIVGHKVLLLFNAIRAQEFISIETNITTTAKITFKLVPVITV